MSSKLTNCLIVISAVLSCEITLSAQDGTYSEYSPYSVFGVGNISKQGNAVNKSMGGVGIATRNRRYVNFLNPASVTARDSLSFMADFSLAAGNKVYKDGDVKSASNTLNVYDFMFSFPVYRSLAFMVGLTPFSNVGYDFSMTYSDDPAQIIGSQSIYSYDATGVGSLYQAFIGAGFSPFRHLSLGGEFIYYFGNLDRSWALSPSVTSQSTLYGGTEAQLRAVTGKFGLQYDIPLGGNMMMTLGATYRLSTPLKGYVDEEEYSYIGSAADTTTFRTDTVANLGVSPRLADELGLGISIRSGERWSAEFNYIRSNWSGTNINKVPGLTNESAANFSLTTSESYSAGFEIVPNRNDIRYYYRKCTYRVGGYYDKEYYKVSGEQVKTVGLTFGMTFPILRLYNGITVGVELGQRGLDSGSMIRERFVNFNIGFNISDIWFQKPRYN